MRALLLFCVLLGLPALACAPKKDATDSEDGSDDGSTDSSDGETPSGSGGSSSVNACTDLSGEADPSCPEVAGCPQKKCEPEIAACLGKNFAKGVYDGPCKAFMDCAQECGDGDTCDVPCTRQCQVSPDCGTCLETAVNPCIASRCSEDVLCSPSAGARTCKDLAACCASLQGAYRESCLAQYDTVVMSGDGVCELVYENFVVQGLCE